MSKIRDLIVMCQQKEGYLFRSEMDRVRAASAELATMQARIEKLESKLALCLVKLSEIGHESYADTIAEDVFETWREIRRKAGRE